MPDSIGYVNPSREFIRVGTDTVNLNMQLPTLEDRSAQKDKQPETSPAVAEGRLTEQDYKEVAEALGVEVAAMKAVVEIEAGREHKGFWAKGKPIINFDLSVYRQMAARHKLNLSKYSKSHPLIFNRPDTRRFGSQQAAVQARLDQAMSIDSVTAIEGTFWGMFQLGGFNWKLCGLSSPQEFVELMSRSERDQLDLFAIFIQKSGLLPALKAKNWSSFARGYNGTNYAARGYHTKLASAYAKYSRKK